MKAVRVHNFGGPDVLKYEEVAAPRPERGEILVRVRAVSVNHFDVWMRTGNRRRSALPFVLGSDVAGEVVEGAGSVQAGDHIVLFPATSCGCCQACERGEESQCRDYRALSGGYAELMIAPAHNAHPLPDALSFEEAAALPIAYLTAWRMVVTKAGVGPGTPVVVMGASGGVGSACVQIAVMRGARVLAGISAVAKERHVLALGAEAAFDYSMEPVEDALRRWLGAPEVSVILDHIGQGVWDQCIPALARGGRLVSCGFSSGPNVRLSLAQLTGHELSVAGVVMGSRREFQALLDVVQEGKLKPVVTEVLPLAEAATAHRRLEDRQALGKVVLVP